MQTEGKVLVIDSGLALAETARDAAGSSSWEIMLAHDRDEAVNRARIEGPEVIILGYLEPQGEAFRVHRELKQNRGTADIPQVVIDVAPEEQAARGWRKSEGLVMDAEEYLCQPVDPQELGRVVRGILARARVADAV